jgi:polar amino acid transport system permease protein
MAWIVFPQGVRNAVPPTSNIMELTRATSLAAVVSLPISTRQCQDIVRAPTPLVAAALIFLLWLWPLVRPLSRLETRMIAGQAG